MDTIDRILALQEKEGISNKNLEKAANLANGSITNWKNRRYAPGVDAIIGLSKYFHVTADYLLCLSDSPTPPQEKVWKSLSEEEQLLLDAFHTATAQGRFRIIQVCMNERDSATKGETANVG